MSSLIVSVKDAYLYFISEFATSFANTFYSNLIPLWIGIQAFCLQLNRFANKRMCFFKFMSVLIPVSHVNDSIFKGKLHLKQITKRSLNSQGQPLRIWMLIDWHIIPILYGYNIILFWIKMLVFIKNIACYIIAQKLNQESPDNLHSPLTTIARLV